MKKLNEYLYYRIYTWNKRLHGDKDGPELNASLGITILMGVNLSFILHILIFIDVIYSIFYNNKGFLFEFPKILSIGIMSILVVIIFFWFIYKKKYLKIVKKFNNETQKQKQVRGMLLFLYIVLSIGLILLFAYIGKHGTAPAGCIL